MSSMRAKVILQKVTIHNGGQETLEFNAVAKNQYPSDGLDENNTFAKFSPVVDLKIQVTNPALHGLFKPGQKFYVDFSEAPD